MIDFIKKRIEFVVLFILTLLIFFIITQNSSFVMSVYSQFQINQQILNFSGTIFGLLLTAYALLFGLIPALSKDVLETDALNAVNFSFFISIILSIILVILSFLIYFIGDKIQVLFVMLQLWLLSFLILLSMLLVFYLFLLFKVQKLNRS